MLYNINKLNKLGLNDEKLENVSYQERRKHFNDNLVLVAKHFHCKVEFFFNEIVLDGPIGKTKHYALRTEFQERGSPHVYAFVMILDDPTIEKENKYTDFVNRSVSVFFARFLHRP